VHDIYYWGALLDAKLPFMKCIAHSLNFNVVPIDSAVIIVLFKKLAGILGINEQESRETQGDS